MSEPADPGPSLLEQRLEIETPERVTIVHDLAGIGSRFAAGTIDALIVGFVGTVLAIVLAIVMGVALPRSDEARQAMALGAVGIVSLVLFLYYAGFEWAWAGQTPGKRVLRLRVISETGAPATASAVFLRNALRVADALPCVAPFGLGGLVMFVNGRAKRIGDFAAGTIVVRERPEPLPVPRGAAPGALAGESFAAGDVARARSFLARRAELIESRRAELAAQVAAAIAARHGIPVRDPVEFLGRVAGGASPAQLRDLAGPPA